MATTSQIRSRDFFRYIIATLAWSLVLLPLCIPGCISLSDCAEFLQVRGRLVDAESGAAVSGAIVGGRTFTDAVETNNIPPLRLSDSDGSFFLNFGTGIIPCDSTDYFPDPDQVEIIVVRDGCEQRFMIEINENTAQLVDGEFPGEEVLELTAPILVPPCDESP